MSRWLAATCTLTLTLLLVSGCGSSCVPTQLTMDPVTITDLSAPVTLRAHLTRDGTPFAGAEVHLQLETKGANDRSGDIGRTVTTDANGQATLTLPEGIAGATLPSDSVVGASAYFQPLNEIDGQEYCWSRTEAAFTCPAGDTPSACPTRDPFAD